MLDFADRVAQDLPRNLAQTLFFLSEGWQMEVSPINPPLLVRGGSLLNLPEEMFQALHTLEAIQIVDSIPTLADDPAFLVCGLSEQGTALLAAYRQTHPEDTLLPTDPQTRLQTLLDTVESSLMTLENPDLLVCTPPPSESDEEREGRKRALEMLQNENPHAAGLFHVLEGPDNPDLFWKRVLASHAGMVQALEAEETMFRAYRKTVAAYLAELEKLLEMREGQG